MRFSKPVAARRGAEATGCDRPSATEGTPDGQFPSRIPPQRHGLEESVRALWLFCTRLSSGGVADEWVTQLLKQSADAKVFKKYSQMKLQMKREALAKLNRQANES